jgi:hypothetical protein
MDPHSTPSDSESIADQSGPSPGGVRPVEEPVEPQALPAEFHAEIDHELFPPPPGHIESEEDELARHEAWVQLMATLTPEQRTDIQRYADATTAAWEQLVGDPGAPPEAFQTVDEIMDNIPNLDRTFDSLSPRTLDRIGEFFDAIIQQFEQLMDIREHIQELRRNVAPLLDGLTNTNLTSLQPDVSQPDSIKCIICLQQYVDSDVVVVLPCHPDHHFHRSCIQVRFLPLTLLFHSFSDFVLHLHCRNG